MSDTVRTESGNLALWTLTGAARRLVPQYVRDLIVSVFSWIGPSYTTLTSSSNATTWATSGEKISNAKQTLSENSTLTITGAVEGAQGYLRLTQNGTGGFTYTLPSGTIVGSTTSVSTTANKTTAIAWAYDGSAFTFCLARES